MVDSIVRHGAELRCPPPGTTQRAEDAANEAVLHRPEDLEDDGLRAARGFAIGLTIAASLWTIWVLLLCYWP